MKNLFLQFLRWHFVEMPKNILKAFKNFLVFNFNYFSVPLLIKTLFAHWRKYGESYGRGFDFKKYLQAFSANAISRGIGAVIRIATIIIALFVEFFILLGGIVALCFWLALPILLAVGLYFGISLLF